MNDYKDIIIGLISLIIGAVLNEFLRRKNRREFYAPQIFDKRLKVYEQLLEKIQNGYTVATEVIENGELTQQERHELISSVIHDIAQFTDTNYLYIDEDLAVHSVALFMGVEDIYVSSEDIKQEKLSNFFRMRREALRMISEDSGVSEINKLFKSINKPKIDGAVIRYFRQLKKRNNKHA